MEKLIIICIQLNPNNIRTEEIRECIKSYGRWWHHIKNVWIVKTRKTTEDVTNELTRFLSSEDSLLVSLFNADGYNGFLTDKAFEWIDSQK